MLIPTELIFNVITGNFRQVVERQLNLAAQGGRFDYYLRCSTQKQATLVDRFTSWIMTRLPIDDRTKKPVTNIVIGMSEEIIRSLLQEEIKHLSGEEILSALKLTDVFTGTDEPKVRAATRDKFKAQYATARAALTVAGFDTSGDNFALDLVALVGQPGESELRFAAVGCQGTCAFDILPQDNNPIYFVVRKSAQPHQREVAKAMVQWHLRNRAAKSKIKTFGFLLGDNFYDCGLSTTDRGAIMRAFERVYWKLYRCDPANKEHDIQWFALLGNHDYNFHGQAHTPKDADAIAGRFKRAMQEVDYTYENDGKQHQWHLPYRYYCLTSAVANFLVIDSMTLLFDREQQEWLKRTYQALNKGRVVWNFLVAHHGFVSYGERGCPTKKGDLGLVKKVMTGPKEEAGNTSALSPMRTAAHNLAGNLNSFLFDWIKGSGMHFDFNLAAHDHFAASGLLSYQHVGERYAKHTYFVLAGAGGASLHGGEIEALYQLKRNCCYDLLEKDYGFVSFEVTQDKVVFRYHLSKQGHYGDEGAYTRTFYRSPQGGFITGEKGKGDMAAELAFQMLKRGTSTSNEPLDQIAKEGLPKHLVQPVLRGVFYKRGEGGKFHSYDYKRRYFQLTWGDTKLYYSPNAGKVGTQIIDLRMVSAVKRTGNQTITLGKETFGHLDVFELVTPGRTWVLAIPEEQAEDWNAWIAEGIKAGKRK